MFFSLLAPILLIFVEFAFAQSPTSFAILEAKSRLNLLKSEVCVSYQEFANGTIPEGPFRVAWWDSIAGNTAVCQPPRSARRFGPNEIVPVQYQSWPQILEKQCQKYAFYTRNMHPIQYQANIATKAGAKALLFVVDRGALNVNGVHDYLHSGFCQPETDEDANGTVFFIYKDAFDQFILPKLRETADVELRFRKPEHYFDVSILLLWLLILLTVFLGSLWSARAARDRLARKGLVPVPQGIELRERGGGAGDSAGATGAKKPFLQTLCWAVVVIVGVILFIIIYAKWHNTVTAVIWTALGIFCMSKCLFAICKYIIFPKRRGEQRVLLHFRKFQLTPLGLICYLIAAAICIPWFFIRKHPMAFLLLDLIDLAIGVFLIKYLTYEPLKKQQTLRDQLICSSVYFLLGVIFLIWFIIFPSKIKCGPIAPIDSDDEQMGSFFVPMFNDPLAACWDPKIELGYRHMSATMLLVVLSAYFLPFWFLVDYINEHKFFQYGFVAFAGYALALLLYLLGQMFLPAINFLLIMPFPVWFGSIFALIKGTFMKLFKGNLQNLD